MIKIYNNFSTLYVYSRKLYAVEGFPVFSAHAKGS